MDPLSIAMLVAGIAGSAATVGGNVYMNRKNNEFNRQMSDPSFMMQRMAAAGINPNAAAQGISGAAPQGSATTFNGMPNISDSLLNALRQGSLTPSEKRNIDADTNVKEGEAEGLGIDNKQKLATFDDNVAILKQNRQMNDYQIEQLRPYAEHADEWYKVNFDNLDEKVKEIRENIKKIDEEIKKIEKEENLIDAQTGEANSNARKNDSITALNRQKKELIDSLGGEDVESAYVIARVEGDDRRADAIKDGIKEYAKSEQRGTTEGKDPYMEEVFDFHTLSRSQANEVYELDGKISHYTQLRDEALKNGNKKTAEFYNDELVKLGKRRHKLYESSKKNFRKGKFTRVSSETRFPFAGKKQ